MFFRQNDTKELRNELERLRSELRDHVSAHDQLCRRVEKLESERYARETELTDLRTRFETLIKRIQARVDRPVDGTEKRESTYELRTKLGR